MSSAQIAGALIRAARRRQVISNSAQRLGLCEVGGIPDPEFEVTRAIVADAANVTAESLVQLGSTQVCRT